MSLRHLRLLQQRRRPLRIHQRSRYVHTDIHPNDQSNGIAHTNIHQHANDLSDEHGYSNEYAYEYSDKDPCAGGWFWATWHRGGWLVLLVRADLK